MRRKPNLVAQLILSAFGCAVSLPGCLKNRSPNALQIRKN